MSYEFEAYREPGLKIKLLGSFPWVSIYLGTLSAQPTSIVWKSELAISADVVRRDQTYSGRRKQ